MSGGKTDVLDPEAKQTEENERLRKVFEEDQKQAEIQDLENKFAAPSFTPPQEVGDPQQPETGDTPITDEKLSDSQPSNEDEKEKDGPDASDVKDAHDKYKKVKGNQEKPTSSESGHSPQNEGSVGEGGANNAANAAGKTEQAGSTAGKAGTTAGETAEAGAQTGAQAGVEAGAQAGVQAGVQAGGVAAAEAGGVAAAEGAAVAGTEGAVTAVGAATSETGVGAVIAGAVLAGIETGKELNRIRKQGIRRIFKYDKIIGKESMKWGKWIGYAFIFLGAIFFVPLAFDDPGMANDNVGTRNTLFVTKTATDVDNEENIEYEITVKSEDTFSDVTVVDQIPNNTQFLGGVGDVTLDCEPAPCGPETRKITWKSQDNGLTPPINSSFKITVLPLVSDTYIVNIAIGGLFGETGERGAPTCTGYQCALDYIVSNSGISSNFRTPERPSHDGIDLSAESRIPIYALEEGSVIGHVNSCDPDSGNLDPDDPERGGCGGGAGNYVFIRTANKGTYKYMHMERTVVEDNGVVARGQMIGLVDHTGHSSGTHLHFQIDNPEPVNPATALANWPN